MKRLLLLCLVIAACAEAPAPGPHPSGPDPTVTLGTVAGGEGTQPDPCDVLLPDQPECSYALGCTSVVPDGLPPPGSCYDWVCLLSGGRHLITGLCNGSGT